MYCYGKNDRKQQIEIMRRCTATASHDVFDFTEEMDDVFKIFFFHSTGISTLALFFGCTEVEVMRKIQAWDLYNWFRSPHLLAQLRENNAAYDEEPEDPNNRHEAFRKILLMRKATADFDTAQFNWTAERIHLLYQQFCIGIGISEIALTLGCTEPMVMQKILDEGYYNSMHFPLFGYTIK